MPRDIRVITESTTFNRADWPWATWIAVLLVPAEANGGEGGKVFLEVYDTEPPPGALRL